MAKHGRFTVIQGSAAPKTSPNPAVACACTNAAPRTASASDETFRAGLEYVACDLRELAKIAPPDRALQVLNLSRLVDALIQR